MAFGVFRNKLSRAVVSKSRRSHLCFSTDGGVERKGTPSPARTLCEVNNHPNYRLKKAKERFAASNLGICNSTKNKQIMFTSPRRLKAPPPRVTYHKTVREHGITIQPNENSAIPNDGTSSGAIAADRLRIARREAIERLGLPIKNNLPSEHPIIQASVRSGELRSHGKPVNEHDLDIVVNENPVRSNDGTSSGAKAADRLRLARRKALENLKSQPSSEVTTNQHDKEKQKKVLVHEVNVKSAQEKIIQETAVKEHGLDLVTYENHIRPNDGTSSGAIAADRLRLARRKVIQSMKEIPIDLK